MAMPKHLMPKFLCQNGIQPITNELTYPCKNTFYAISQHHYLTSKHADQSHLLPKDLFSKKLNTFM